MPTNAMPTTQTTTTIAITAVPAPEPPEEDELGPTTGAVEGADVDTTVAALTSGELEEAADSSAVVFPVDDAAVDLSV